METKRRIINNISGILGVLFFVVIALASSSAEKAYQSSGWEGSYGQRAAQHVAQKQQGGTYVGVASSQEEAESMARKAGYSAYNFYPSTGQVFGY